MGSVGRYVGAQRRHFVTWNRREWTATRHQLPRLIYLPFLFIVVSLFTEGDAKLYALEIGISIAWWWLIRVFCRRAAFGIEVGSTVEMAATENPVEAGRRITKAVNRTGKKVFEAVRGYSQLAGAVIASQLTIGNLAIIIPAHENPARAIQAFLGIGGIVFYAVWMSKGTWWKPIVLGTSIASTAIGFAGTIWPETFTAVSLGYFGRQADHCRAAWVRGTLPDECRTRTGSVSGAEASLPPLCADQRSYEVRLNEPLLVPLQPNCRSGWVSMPIGRYNVRFKTADRGLVIFPSQGEPIGFGPNDRGFRGNYRLSTIRLMGGGEVTIFAEPL